MNERRKPRALLLDFDGVIADTEPLHFRFFAEILEPHGILLTQELYDTNYLGLGDRSCFRAVFRHQGRPLAGDLEEALVQEKNARLLQSVRGGFPLLPGVREFLLDLKGRIYLAIVSGSLKSEIEAILAGDEVRPLFHVIIGAEEVSKGKPDPAGFLEAIKLLNRDHVPESEILLPVECLAVEDSPWGIEAANRAGVRCVAVTTSYPQAKLTGAERVISGLPDLGEWV